MAEPIVVGRVENPADLNLEPVAITVVGYTIDSTEVSETFLFRPVIPAGAQLEVIRHTDATGKVPLGQIVEFLDACLLEDQLAPFNEFLHRSDVMIEQGTYIGVYQSLTEHYAARPTMQPSASAHGGPAAKRTSRAAARSAASA